MESKIKFFKINKDYLRGLQKIDYRVSLKEEHRAFIGVEIIISKKKYCIPLTSTVIPKSGKKRSSYTTFNIKNENGSKVIACLLINNMIPVEDKILEYIDFTTLDETSRRYHIEEYIYLKKEFEILEKKANSIYKIRITNANKLLNEICCNFLLLEEKMREVIESI